MQNQTCAVTGQQFEITEKDLKFYKMMDLPLPTLCPEERQRRRLSWRNELNLYKRKCDLTGQDIISIYSPDKPYKVYHHQEWYGDKWDALQYGRPFDFNRPFFEQFQELFLEVPKLGLVVLGDNENSDYTHDNYRLKNCYMVFDGEQGLDCLYGETFGIIKSCMDFLYLSESELCYECVNCEKCYNVSFSKFCSNCSDSYFLTDCKGCRNCFGCVNLRNKQYHIANKPYSKEDYEKILATIDLKSHSALQQYLAQTANFAKSLPKRATRGLQNENVTGDNVNNSKDSFECYDSSGLRDCKFMSNCMMGAQDCYDIDIWGDQMRRCYDCDCAGAESENIIACYYCALQVSNIYHSAYCMKNCHNIFGSTGLVQKQYCILNKQYSREDYEALLPRIIEHLKKTGEWGQFFPIEMSQFGYNETVANDYMPLTKEQAQQKGYKWKDPDPKEYQPASIQLPDHLDEITDEIINEILACAECSRNYRITEHELSFHRRQKLALPRECFYCRHHNRRTLRNPRKLFSRTCAKCNEAIRTTYDSDSPEIVYCEACYLASLS